MKQVGRILTSVRVVTTDDRKIDISLISEPDANRLINMLSEAEVPVKVYVGLPFKMVLEGK